MTLPLYSGEMPVEATPRQLTVEYFDASRAQDAMAQLCCVHKLQVADPGAVHFRHTRFKLSAVTVSQIEYGTDARVEYSDIGDYYTLSLPMSGSQELRQGNHVAVSDCRQGLIISPTQPVYLEMSGDCKKRLVQISRAAVERQLTTMLERPVSDPVVFSPTMDAKSGPGASWWRTIKHLELEQHYEGSLYRLGPVQGGLERMLISGLLYAQRHNYSSDLHSSDNQVAPTHVRRAEAFIQAHAMEPISIEDIVAASGVPRRTLYDGFKRFRGFAPIHYLRSVRMEGARSDILKGRDQHNITSIAMKWGFSHLGRFSIEYKRRFGESPSDTLKR